MKNKKTEKRQGFKINEPDITVKMDSTSMSINPFYRLSENTIYLRLDDDIDKSSIFIYRATNQEILIEHEKYVYYSIHHEFLHALLNQFINLKTCRDYDNLVGYLAGKGELMLV